MATFDFFGTTPTVGANPFTGTANYNEEGVDFTFTSGGTGGLVTFATETGSGDGDNDIGIAVEEGASATLSVVDSDPGESFLSDIEFAISGVFNTGGNPQITLSNTVLGVSTVMTFDEFFFGGRTTIAAPAGEWNTINFSAPSGTYFYLDSINATPTCFCAGTRIATPKGETAVEDLCPGDEVLTTTGTHRVKWIGQQFIDTRLTHPARVNPVRIAAGALGNGLPRRDLRLSGEHAIEIGGVLYNAATLVNGRTIRQEPRMPRQGFTYFHVETEGHVLLLAEGIGAESYIDYTDRSAFDNAEQGGRGTIAEMPLPRVSAPRLVPDTLREELSRIADSLAAEESMVA